LFLKAVKEGMVVCKREGQRDLKYEKNLIPSLVLNMQEGSHKPRNVGSLENMSTSTT
jgi:hypothetical protein